MFSSKVQLQKRTPENAQNRESFLSLLVDEYLNSASQDAKRQVLANLANFAYDPINYGYIRTVGVLDVFLHVLKSESNETLVHFATAGICNLCVDPLNAAYILEHGGLGLLITLLKSEHADIVANTVTSLIYLNNEKTKPYITSTDICDVMNGLKHSDNKCLSNLATIFLEDACISNSI